MGGKKNDLPVTETKAVLEQEPTRKHYIFLDGTTGTDHQADYYRISEDSFDDAPITQDLWLTLL